MITAKQHAASQIENINLKAELARLEAKEKIVKIIASALGAVLIVISIIFLN